MLFFYELKKILFTYHGLWIILSCFLLKCVFLSFVPERIDSRIKLSRIHYDNYLSVLYGPDSEEKQLYIENAYNELSATIMMGKQLQASFDKGEISEEEWFEFCKNYEYAQIHLNALELFEEKRSVFADQDKTLSPAWYIDEYGWQTVFFLQHFPDIFFIFAVILIASQNYSYEKESGILPVLMTSKKGRINLHLIKTALLVLVFSLSAALFSLSEVLILQLRGFLSDGEAPIYSISEFSGTVNSDVTLSEAYIQTLIIRTLTGIVYALGTFFISVWVMNAARAFIGAVILIAVQYLFIELPGKIFIFFPSCLLAGTEMLKTSDISGISPGVSLLVFFFMVFVAFCHSIYKFRDGSSTNRH